MVSQNKIHINPFISLFLGLSYTFTYSHKVYGAPYGSLVTSQKHTFSRIVCAGQCWNDVPCRVCSPLTPSVPAWMRVRMGNDNLSVCNSSGSRCLSCSSCSGLILSRVQCAAVQGWCNLNANQVETTGTMMQATVQLVIPREMRGGGWGG